MYIKLLSTYPSEISTKFIQGMIERMDISFTKYGLLSDAYPDKVNAIESLRARLRKYEQTGNTEFLIDVANFAMIEFKHPAHKDAHYKPTDSNESPGRVWHGSKIGNTKENR